MTLELGPVGKVWCVWGVPGDRGSGTAESNESERKCQQPGGELPRGQSSGVTAPKRLQERLGKLAGVGGPGRHDAGATKVLRHPPGRRNPTSARSAGPGVSPEGGSCPSHAPSQLELLGSWTPGCPRCRAQTALPTGPGRLRHAELAPGQSWPWAQTPPWRGQAGSRPSMVSVAGGPTVPCCSGPKVAALTVATLLLLTGIGAASWAIGESGSLHLCPPLPLRPRPTRPHLCLLCSDRSPQE